MVTQEQIQGVSLILSHKNNTGCLVIDWNIYELLWPSLNWFLDWIMNWMNELMDVSDMLAWDYIGPVLIRWRQKSLWAAGTRPHEWRNRFQGIYIVYFFHIWCSILCSWYWHESLSLQSRYSTIDCKRINESSVAGFYTCFFISFPILHFSQQQLWQLPSQLLSLHPSPAAPHLW